MTHTIQEIYDKFYDLIEVENYTTYNFTITYDPKSITLKESWDIRFEEILSIIQSNCVWGRPDAYIMCKESMKNHYCHIHGQVIYSDAILYHRDLAKLRADLRGRYGRCSFIKNQSKKELECIHSSLGIESKESVKRDYTEYILKDVKQNESKIKDYTILQYQFPFRECIKYSS